MLNRFWSWTSPPIAPALPVGALRFRAWTSAPPVTGTAETGLPFGPMRFRAWTSGVFVPPVVDAGGGGRLRPISIPIDAETARRLRRDDELWLWIISFSSTTKMLD